MLVYSDLVVAYFEALGADPVTGATTGRFYQNTVSHVLKFYANGGWKTVMDLETAQAVTGAKTFTSPIINSGELDNSFVDGYLDFNEETAPSSPSAGKIRVFGKSDKKLYTKNSDGTEQEIGSGASGGAVDYITNGRFEIDTTGWATYADAAATTPVDGTGGSASITIARNTTTPLRGTADLKITKGATNRQGDGVGYAFTIPRQDVGKKLLISFDYDTNEDAAYASGDLAVYVYDVTNGALLTPTSTSINVGEGTMTTSFDATSATSYRLIFHVASTNASAWDVYIDNVSVSPGVIAQGSVIGPEIAYTPTLGAMTSNSLLKCTWQRIGSTMRIKGSANATGAVSGNISIPLPTGYTIDGTNINASPEFETFGNVYGVDNLGAYYVGAVVWNSSSSCRFRSATASWNATNPFTWASGDTIGWDFTVPVTEWAGSGAMNVLQDDTMTEWVSYTPTSPWVANTTTTGRWKRVGDDMLIQCKSVMTGAPTAAALTYAMPAGYTIDTTKAITTSDVISLGTGLIYRASSGLRRGCFVSYASGTTFNVYTDGVITTGASGAISETNPHTFANGDQIAVEFKVPILEWRGKSVGAVGFARATATQAGLVSRFIDWTTPTFNAGDFTGTASMTTTVAAGDVTTFAYTVIGNMMTVVFNIDNFTVGGTVSTVCKIAIPGGFVSTKGMWNTCYLLVAGTREVGSVFTDAAGTVLNVRRAGATNWVLGSDNSSMTGQITFQIN